MTVRRPLFLVLIAVLMSLPLSVTGAESDSPLIHEGIVDAGLKDVWAAFTTKEGAESWMAAHAEISLKIGGTMLTVYDPKASVDGPQSIENTYLCFDPLRMLAFHVTRSPRGFPFPNAVKNMWTVIYFDEAGPGKTRVRIVCQGFGQDDESKNMRDFFDKGNAFALKELQKKFAPNPPAK